MGYPPSPPVKDGFHKTGFGHYPQVLVIEQGRLGKWVRSVV